MRFLFLFTQKALCSLGFRYIFAVQKKQGLYANIILKNMRL